MKKKLAAFYIIILFCLCYGCDSDKANTGAVTEEAPVSIEVVKAQTGDISSYIHATGTVFPKQEAYLSPKIGGNIERIFVDEGDRVKQGQPLIQLDQTNLIIAKNEAAAQLNTVKAELKKAELSLENMRRNLKRIEELHRQGVVDEQTYDSTRTEFLNAEAHYQLSGARLEQSRAQLDRASQELADSMVYAPFPGFVVEKIMNEGEMVYTMSPSKVLHITDISTVKIECDIAEAKKSYVHMGKQATIVLDALPTERFTGTVTVINPRVDPISRTFKIKIAIENPQFKLESGMFARIRILEQEKKAAVLVPFKSVIERDGKKVLFTVENNRAEMVPVAPGIIDNATVEIISGLRGGELIVSEGFYALSNGARVHYTLPEG